MMRRWLVVIEDPFPQAESPEALEAFLAAAIDWDVLGMKLARVRRGGLLADKVMEELPPVRHKDQGAYR